MTADADILIIGGGLAGLTAGIHLARRHLRVLLLEKHPYPQHKVCGEYMSNEVVPYLNQLGIDVTALHPSHIDRFLFSTVSGKTIESELPLGGLGMSRYALDSLMYQQAIGSGVDVRQEQVDAVQFEEDSFRVRTSTGRTYRANIVIGAYGKRSALDKQLHRGFIQQESSWMAVKAHYQGPFPDDLVALHHFEGGYCGLCQVENEVVNACYLTNYNSFKPYKNIGVFQQQVMSQNPFLKDFFAKATPLFDKPLTISQISFAKRPVVEQHMLMCGDTAGVIHPLCGNGMAMAIHSAKLASELIMAYVGGMITSRPALEQAYTAAWNRAFKTRLATGRIVQSLLQNTTMASVLLNSLQRLPSALPLLIKQTHGRPLVAAP